MSKIWTDDGDKSNTRPAETDNYAENQKVIESIDSLGHGIAVWSDHERLVYCNKTCRSLFDDAGLPASGGFTHDAFVAALMASGLLLLPADEKAWADMEVQLFRQGGASEYSRIDGRFFRNERWRRPDGGVVMQIRDITEEKRTELTLRRAISDADDSARNKSRFLRAANHDLRQPLATLKILIYNCMMTDEEDHRSDLLHAMDISVSIMEDLLGALLNVGQLDAGQVKPRITTFQLSTLLDRMDIEFSHQAREKGLNFRIVQSRSAVVSDRALLERVVSNLIANAIRYTEHGSVLVGCRRAGNRIRLEVRDSGVGIAAEHREEIFQEFFQVDHSRKRRGALGLGLSISKRIADILEHPLDVRSRVGEGSIFSVELPVGDILQSNIGEPEISERIGGEFVNLSVLVLEDDEILRGALAELLERWGIKVVAFNAFGDLAERIQDMEFEPDLIITDFRLHGGLTGNDVVGDIRRTLNRNVPAIVVTADTDPKLIESIRHEGFPVLIKPVNPPRLRVMMHNILYEPHLVRELKVSDDSAEEASQ